MPLNLCLKAVTKQNGFWEVNIPWDIYFLYAQQQLLLEVVWLQSGTKLLAILLCTIELHHVELHHVNSSSCTFGAMRYSLVITFLSFFPIFQNKNVITLNYALIKYHRQQTRKREGLGVTMWPRSSQDTTFNGLHNPDVTQGKCCFLNYFNTINPQLIRTPQIA